jgi:uncharacterized protein YjbI with pentapeptide repeats
MHIVVLTKDAESWFIADSSPLVYDAAQYLKDVERSVGGKKLKRKPEPKRRIRWPRWTGISGSTLRDWLPIVGALLIPLLIFYGTARITGQQGKLENDRAEAERKLAKQRAQDEALQAYLDQMSTLMLEKDLRNSEGDSEVRTLAQARTQTVLRRVDTSRREEIMNFLLEADLVREVGGSAPVITLAEADLHGTNLTGADLHGATLSLADLHGTLWSLADLSGADLFGADLSGADLFQADLSGADLTLADLSGANLRAAKGITNEKLERQARSLKGATMPNGQKYEDWLKDREGGGEDE